MANEITDEIAALHLKTFHENRNKSEDPDVALWAALQAVAGRLRAQAVRNAKAVVQKAMDIDDYANSTRRSWPRVEMMLDQHIAELEKP